jgi:serine/threonine protein phosphatase PrpC
MTPDRELAPNPSAIESERQEQATSATSTSAAPDAPSEPSDEAVTQPLIDPLQARYREAVSEDRSQRASASSMSETVYLDRQQRYRLLEPPNPQQVAVGTEISYGAAVRVLDCQPFQKSPLEALLEQHSREERPSELSLGKEELIRPVGSPSDAKNILGIPAIAQPYLILQASYYPTLPEVHDAWQQEQETVLLLEDRSDWQLLSDLWDSEELSTLQILYWLDEMAKLWEALETWHCRQSLLEIDNLRVDEDQALGLQYLYPEMDEQSPTLENLGRMWQLLFDQSQRTQFTSLGDVFRQMCTGEIDTIEVLRSHLEAIAREQQSSAIAAASRDREPDILDEEDVTEDMTANDPAAIAPKTSPANEVSPTGEGDDLPTVILPMQLLSLDDAGCTDIGHQRDHNEDTFGIQTAIKKQENPMGRAVQARGLYVLCDGMGGHEAGEVASAMAVETIKRYFQEHWQEQFPDEEGVREAIRAANQAIYEVNQKNARSGSGRMGTTLVMLLVQNTKAAIAHVGDSRLYRLTRKRGLEQLTVDHEVGQREIRRGVEPGVAYSRPDAYQLTQALGPRNEQSIDPDVQFLELNEDTLFLLCSDGLSDNELVESHWQTHLAPLLSSRANLDRGILQLIELANEHNGHDNITAVLIRVKVRPNFEQQQLH